MAEDRIVVYRHPNQEMRSYIISEAVSEYRVEHFTQPLQKQHEEILRSLGIIGRRVVEGIVRLSGVQEVTIKPKEVIVKKGLTATWEDLEPEILHILNHAVRQKRLRVVKKGPEKKLLS